MRKCWKWLIGIVALLLVVLLVWALINFYYFSTKRLPPWEKKNIEQVYFDQWCMSDDKLYNQHPIIWFDENDGVEAENVWRYIGKYGDCYAFLVIEDNIDGFGSPWEGPYPIEGLSREVIYPTNEACIMLYHTQKEFTYEQMWQFEFESDAKFKMYLLSEIKNREEWLTDAQFEQLTCDVEKLAKQQS